MYSDNLPEEYDGLLECSSLAICCSFNRRGSLLAVGCNDGRIIIWDFLTRGVAKSILAHENYPICSIGWSRNGHKIITASLDNTVAIWHVLSADCLVLLRFPSPILKSQFNPRNENIVLVSLVKHPSILFEINYEKNSAVYKVLPIDKEDLDPNVIASFDRRGKHIYTGNSKGRVAIIKCPVSILNSTETPEIMSSFRIQTTSSVLAAIKEIEFPPRNKTNFLVNSSDKTIRLFSCDNALRAGLNGFCEESRKYQDLVNKTMWRRCCFSGDREAFHVCGGSARQHALHIWETESGTVKKILQGTRGELLLDVQWHPSRPLVTSISSGLISIWARPQIENWSAFAPDFRELEENVEYEERESEFDEEDEDNHLNPDKGPDAEAAEHVDITSVEVDEDLMSSDEEEIDKNALNVIPIQIEDYEKNEPDQIEQNILSPSNKKQPVIIIEIALDNAPINETHPLTQSTPKKIRVNDKWASARKVARLC